jgi:hypothetical protein
MQRFVAAAACCLLFAAGSGTAQRTQNLVAPRTSWGDPDLAGTWTTTDMSGVPIERPHRFGNRQLLTDEEFADLRKQMETQAQIDAADFDLAAVPAAPNVGEFGDRLEGRVTAVNFLGPDPLWYERGTPSRQTSLLVDPPDGRFPPLTAGGQQRSEQLARRRARPVTMSDRTPYPRCLTRGLVGSVLPMITDSGNDIVQAPGFIVIRHEMIHEARVIPLDNRRHIAPTILQYMGDSRGRWDGDSLVIETRNLRENVGVNFNGGGATTLSSQARIVERLTRTSVDTIRYQVTVDDPGTWTRSWTMAFPWHRDESYQLFEFACHEGNRAMRSTLAAELAQSGGR